MPAASQTVPDELFAGGGEMGALMAAKDWSATPLGPVETWSQGLKTAVAILLRSPVPIVILWGEDGIMIYNDAASVLVGSRHPGLLGLKVFDAWPEVADFSANVMEVGLSGGTLTYRDKHLVVYRHGVPEDVWMNLDSSPVIDESGRPAGVLAIVVETTGRVINERRLGTLREIGERTAGAGSLEAVCHAALAAMAANQADLPNALLYLLEREDKARLLTWYGAEPRDDALEIDLRASGDERAAQLSRVRATGSPEESDAELLLAALPTATDPDEMLVLPITSGEIAVGFLVVGMDQFLAPKSDYRHFLNLVAAWISKAAASAKALEEERGRAEALAESSLIINSSRSLREVLEAITEQAQKIVGAHQAMASMTVNQQWAQAIHAVILSDKYAIYRYYDRQPDGSGIYAMVCETNQPVRMTQEELEAHPRWRGFGEQADAHPPMRGWLAAPLTTRTGENLGLIQLSDKVEGEFTAEDELLLVQLAHLASVAAENARLYDEVSRAVQARDDLLAKVSHDLGNSLNSVLVFTRILLEDGTLADGDSFYIETIDEAAQMMKRLIRDLLDVSRLEAGTLWIEPAPEEVLELIQEASQMSKPLVERQGLTFVADIDPDAPRVAADRERILQVLQNLIINALKFTSQGSITLRAVRHGGEVLFSVSDTGCGIPAEELPHLFDRFWQARHRSRSGAGLGLAIVKGIVEAHGGRVWVESVEGEGSTFSFTLPVA